MAVRTNQEQLNLGAPFDPDLPAEEGEAWRNAFYTVYIGRDDAPTNFGDFLARKATTITGATVTADVHTPDLPGPVLHVQATTATSAGVKNVRVDGTPIAGQVQITTDSAGRDTLTFNSTDAVTECAYRQITMPAEIADGLEADTDPEIEA